MKAIHIGQNTLGRVKELTDEVNQLHPVLQRLFEKIPGIEHVYYNQGSQELGADFILYKKDEHLLRTTHVGVVVKATQIRQGSTDVERQIKECFVPRRAPDGSIIQIREVWVVTSQEITQNAREVLAKEYSDKKVEFVPASDLASLIDRFCPELFLGTTPALSRLADSLRDTIVAENQRSLVIPGVQSFYVEPSVTRVVFDGYGRQESARSLPGLEGLLKQLLESNISIIQAGAGGGKSRIAREFIEKVLESDAYRRCELVPLLEHAKDHYEIPEETLARKSAEIRAAVGASNVPLLFFLDGFDEIDVGNSDRSKTLEAWSRLAVEHSLHIVVLSRPFDASAVLGSKAQSMDVFRIQPLKGSRAIEFLKKVVGVSDLRTRILEDLGRSTLVNALDGAPIAYLLLGRLLAENQHDLPSNLTELFQKYTELVLGRWEIAKGLRSQKEYEVLVEALTWMSGFMLENQLPELALHELTDWIEGYCCERRVDVQVKDLVDRVSKRDSVLYYRSDIQAVGFRHRAFAEFFHARGLSRKKAEINLGPEVFSPYWVNSYFFLAGTLRDCPDLLTSLVEIPLEKESERLLRAVNFGNLLLAGYLTPASVSVLAIKKITRELAEIYLHASVPGSDSSLSRLPTIQILCAITMAFRSQYGYGHFTHSLEEVIYELEAAETTPENAISLLLLNSAYKQAGGELRFDELLEKFGDHLPLVVKLAIGHESASFGAVSKGVQRMERNLRRSFKGRRGIKEFFHKIYRVPVARLLAPIF